MQQADGDSDYEDMEELTRRELLQQKQLYEKQKRADAKKVQEFQEDFQKENLKSFQDRPDEI